MTTMYHGTFDSSIATLNAGTYVTPNLETAREYGPVVYAVEVEVDHDVVEEINGRRYITGWFEGTCSRPGRHIDMPHVLEARIRVALPVSMVA